MPNIENPKQVMEQIDRAGFSAVPACAPASNLAVWPLAACLRSQDSRQKASPKLLINPWSCFLTLSRGRLSNCSFNRIVHTTW